MTRTDATSIHLAKRTLIRLSSSARDIRCESGCLWITQDGEQRDIVLEPGQQFQRDGSAGTIVYALEPAHMTIRHAPSTTTARGPLRAALPRMLAME